MNLSQVRVLDLSRLLPGPFATQLLADLGMDIIKIEDTDRGDYARHIDLHPDTGFGTTFQTVNRGKRSVALDLKTEEGTQIFYDMCEKADVIFETFRPGVVDQLGIDYDTLTQYNEDIVYCSLTGFGQDSPFAQRAGHDLNYAALAGYLDLNRHDETEEPRIPGYPIVDMSSGLFAAFSIVAGLMNQILGDGGEYIDIAMTDVLTSFSQVHLDSVCRGEHPRPGKTRLTGQYPCYGVYKTRDGRYITLAALEPDFWENFCTTIGRDDLIPYHLSDDSAIREELRDELQTIFARKSFEEWEEILSGTDATTMGVYTLSETLSHPHTDSRNLVEQTDDGISYLGFPAKMDGGLTQNETLPGHGEHTIPLLRELGYSDEEIDALLKSGIVSTP